MPSATSPSGADLAEQTFHALQWTELTQASSINGAFDQRNASISLPTRDSPSEKTIVQANHAAIIAHYWNSPIHGRSGVPGPFARGRTPRTAPPAGPPGRREGRDDRPKVRPGDTTASGSVGLVLGSREARLPIPRPCCETRPRKQPSRKPLLGTSWQPLLT
jgi:hypothetical protein